MVDRFLGDAFGVFSNQFWSFSAVWCSVAETHLKLLDRAASGARFLTGGVFECDISHRRSVAVLCMLYKIRCNSVHPLNGDLPGPYVPAQVTHSALVAHRYTYAPPRCRTLQYSRTFIPFSVSLWNDLANPVYDGVGLAGFKSRANAFFYRPKLLYPYYSLLLFLFFLSLGWYCGAGVFRLIWCISLSPSLALPTFFNNNNNNNISKIGGATFSVDPQNPYIFYATHFLHIVLKI